MLKQKFLVHFGSNIISRLLGILAGILVARIAGPEVIGTIAYGTSYVGVWSFITGLFGSGHIKLISEGKDSGKCISVYSRILFLSGLVYFLVVFVFFLTQKYILLVTFESSTQQAVIVVLLLVSVLEIFYQLNSTTYNASMEVAKANAPIFLRSIFWQLGRIIIVLMGFKALGLAVWNLAVTLFFIPVIYVFLKKHPKNGWDANLFKEYVKYAIPIFLIVVINSFIQFSDKLFLAHYTSTTELGYFSAANSIGGLIMIASVSAGTIFFPLFSSYISKGEWVSVKQKIMQYNEFLSIFVFPFVCAIVIISEPILINLLGRQYEPSIRPFMIIALATYISVVGMPYGNIITGAGRFYLNVLINLLKLAVFLISLTILLSPNFLNMGAVGLALNLLILNIFTNLCYLFFSKKLSGLSYFSLHNNLRYLLTILLAAVFYLKIYFSDNSQSFFWVFLGPVYFILVYCIMFTFRLVKRNNFKQFIDLLNLRKIFSYVSKELNDKQLK